MQGDGFENVNLLFFESRQRTADKEQGYFVVNAGDV